MPSAECKVEDYNPASVLTLPSWRPARNDQGSYANNLNLFFYYSTYWLLAAFCLLPSAYRLLPLIIRPKRNALGHEHFVDEPFTDNFIELIFYLAAKGFEARLGRAA